MSASKRCDSKLILLANTADKCFSQILPVSKTTPTRRCACLKTHHRQAKRPFCTVYANDLIVMHDIYSFFYYRENTLEKGPMCVHIFINDLETSHLCPNHQVTMSLSRYFQSPTRSRHDQVGSETMFNRVQMVDYS